MKIKNILLSMLIIMFGFIAFTGCNKNVKLTLKVNSEQGYILCSNQEPVYTNATYVFKKGTKVTVNAMPNAGYAFNGWTGTYPSNKQDYDFFVKKNATLTANFTKISYNVSFDYNGATATDNSTSKDAITVQVGDAISLPTFANNDALGRFIGWYHNDTLMFEGTETTFAVPSNIDRTLTSLTLTAKFLIPRTVTFDVDGVQTSETYCLGDALTFPTAEKANHVFLGWYVNEEKYEATTLTIDENITLVAKFAQLHTVSFEGDFEETFEPITTYVGDSEIALPTIDCGNPEETTTTRKFSGWSYNDGTETVTFTTTLLFTYDSDIILTAMFDNKYKISYYANGGEELASSYIFQNEYFTEAHLPTPQRTMPVYDFTTYVPTFRCWTYKNQTVTTETKFTADHDISLVAQWNIYIIKVETQNAVKFEHDIQIFMCGTTQAFSDAIPFKSMEQQDYISESKEFMKDDSNTNLLFWTLDPTYSYSKRLQEDFYGTAQEFVEKARTVESDGIESAGFVYGENQFAYNFVFADDYGTPIVEQDASGYDCTTLSPYQLDSDSVIHALTIYAAWSKVNA